MKAPVFNLPVNAALSRFHVAPPYIANFDSASAMLRATGAFLRGSDFGGMGTAPPVFEPVVRLVDKMPRPVQEVLYAVGSGSEGIAPERLGDVSAEAVAQWMVQEYPQREYPAVAIGSSSGALVHLCAALGIPWLPQTFMIPVSNQLQINPDEPKEALEWGRKYARPLLDANPELQLHHMHDPNQDRLTIQGMTYFRVKRRVLGHTYEEFLSRCLPPGGTIFLVDCQRTWETTQAGDRHFFQFGALGGATMEEFLHGSERVERYLEYYKSHRRQWDVPPTDGLRPEAEWGFEPTLQADIERVAREKGYRIRRIVFGEPEHLSPFVAELYRWWYERRNIPANRLLVESFLLVEPMWALRTGSAPFWMKFNMEPSLEWLESYLKSNDRYDEIYMILFSHGVDAIGLPSIEQWQTVFTYARKHGNFIGVDETVFPRNFSTLIRYHTDLQRQIPARYPLPRPLTLEQLNQFIQEEGDRFPVGWHEGIEQSNH
ncbi:hypothetical protein C7B76_09880 [filamentous cyanobacterium CCP2]|nr:hypothetical protein C7B76_09880 [filamentous cyanobacterium CCP2]